ncbi:MAG TPA: hypothetical protein VMB19_09370 [Silvibacterium sp.]|nr:hypothetical protein [Silvibacterium sp.]
MFLLVAYAFAQTQPQEEPKPAGSSPAYDVSLGYTYLGTATPVSAGVNLNGLDASARVEFTRHWGASVDSFYVRASNVLNTGHNGYVLSFLTGPVFFPFERGGTQISLRALAGVGLVDSAVPVSGKYYLHGWVIRPSYALGGGVEHSVWGPFGLRIDADYLRTAFVNTTATVQPQNNLRVTGSIVFRLKRG